MSNPGIAVSGGPDAIQARQLAVEAVAMRMETMLHSMTAMYDLCNERISNPLSLDETGSTFVVLREMLRSAARDLEVGAETLRNRPGSLGYYEGHFGKV